MCKYKLQRLIKNKLKFWNIRIEKFDKNGRPHIYGTCYIYICHPRKKAQNQKKHEPMYIVQHRWGGGGFPNYLFKHTWTKKCRRNSIVEELLSAVQCGWPALLFRFPGPARRRFSMCSIIGDAGAVTAITRRGAITTRAGAPKVSGLRSTGAVSGQNRLYREIIWIITGWLKEKERKKIGFCSYGTAK